MRLFSNCLVFQRIFDIDVVVVVGIAAVAAGSVAVVVVVAIVLHLALDNVEYVAVAALAALAVVAVASAVVARIADDVAGIRLAVGRFSVNIGQLCDLTAAAMMLWIVVAAVAGMPTLMCSLRVKVAPNH